MSGDDQVATYVHDVAVALLPELPDLGSGTAAYIFERVPEFARQEVSEVALAACQANSAALLDALMRGITIDAMAPSEEVIRTTRDLAKAISLDTLVSGYQVGIAYWCSRWTRAVERYCDRAGVPVALRVTDYGTTFLLSWLQMITNRLSVAYRDEAERLSREWSMARTEEARRILASDDVDITTASRRLGYDLTRHHVALVVVRDGSNQAPLEATARELAGTISGSRPLTLLVDSDTLWCWIPTNTEARATPVREGVTCGQGRPGHGLDGFRLSHRQALEAVRVARLAGRGFPAVTHFSDIELTALCSHEPAALSQFVTSVLGALADPSPHNRLLRETLRSFYAENCNYRATAARLLLHHNTIRYRLAKAEEALGRGILDRRLETEIALHLEAQLGTHTNDADE
ncbi:PucR family transcriptional regulator [Rhodococcus aetherivorans]|uniref:PucR family transcriptional regulator n=1 Tax=Rhodococcus aetherivorans TaxID=191292 RepID=UPI002949A8EA|nr:helix-turn-helix domain-containing protein [Rhodococcus aetherivorans]MDV6295627.1 helix-turn-helix domain-containing protein [Rhodococcus aetherivorans]